MSASKARRALFKEPLLSEYVHGRPVTSREYPLGEDRNADSDDSDESSAEAVNRRAERAAAATADRLKAEAAQSECAK